MLKTLLENQRIFLNQFFDKVDLKTANQLLEMLICCKGMPIFSGVGKSGHIAEKITTTFLSTGIRSFFLSPTNALHGDIGVVSKEDVFVCFSKSGGSAELIDLLPHIQRKGAKTVAIVSKKNSKLQNLCDLTIYLPVEKEICPFDLVPTTSSAVQLIFGDCLAMALMQAKRFSLKDFAANHPAGLLGRKITFKVSQLMLKGEEIPLCKPNDQLIDCLHELSIKRCGCLIVVDENKAFKGIFTDGDLRRAIQVKGPKALKMKLSELMTQKAKSISPSNLAVDAAKIMEEDPSRLITVLPVLESSKVIGLIRMHDILQKELST